MPENAKFRCKRYSQIFHFIWILMGRQAGLFSRKVEAGEHLTCLDSVDSGGRVAGAEYHDGWRFAFDF